MKYLVLKQMENDGNMETNNDRIVQKNITQSATSHFFNGQAKKSRRFRSAFTTEQIKYLENEYKKFPYIGSGNRKEVSTILNIPERAVKIWFQNRRMKEKKDVANKEAEDEEQKKINMACQGQLNIKTVHHQSHTTQPYNVCQSKLKTIYQNPSSTKASINNCNGNKNFASNEFPKPIQNKITVKNFNNRNFTETNSRIVKPTVSRQLNNKYVPMKVIQNKNISIAKVTPPMEHKLDNIKVKQEKLQDEIPQDLTSETQTCPQVVQPKYYQINSNQERYMPLHVPTLPQPKFVPGNILWKPVNMMPVVPGMGPPHPQLVHNNGFSLIHPNFRKEECKCNCNTHNNSQEMSPLINIDGRLHLQSQYVLAMPFNHQFDRI